MTAAVATIVISYTSIRQATIVIPYERSRQADLAIWFDAPGTIGYTIHPCVQ